jgi:hypothetical protein
MALLPRTAVFFFFFLLHCSKYTDKIVFITTRLQKKKKHTAAFLIRLYMYQIRASWSVFVDL